ncbi:MAG: PAS domain S-box protein, partial [Parafilimonas sp.]
LQQKALAFFHYALKSHGALMLGRTEGLSAHTGLFSIADRKHKFFLRIAAAVVPLDVDHVAQGTPLAHGKPLKETPAGLDLEKETDRLIWERYSHAALVVNNDLQILLVRGDTSPYLRLAPGKAALQLLRMLRTELVVEVSAAIQKTRRGGGSVRREGIEIEQGRQLRGVNIEVRPFLAAGGRERYFLILFEEAGLREQPPAMPAAGKGNKLQERELLRVRNELAHTREYVQAIIRDQESTNDELKTVNEEALSGMEELQSTNEELETSRKELQSSNEELVTLNEQLQNRNAELAHRSDELTNVLNGAGFPILILDTDWRIRLFTPPAEKVLGLLPTDVGRPIGNLRLGVLVPDLEELISTVVAKGGDVRREVQNPDGRWYALHIRPFWTGERKIEGVLMAFVDVHEFKLNKEALQKERNFIAAILDAAKDLLVVVRDREGSIVHFNRVCQQITGYSLEEVRGRKPWDLLVVPEEAASVRATLRQVCGGTPVQRESHWLARDGRRLLISWSNSIVKNDDDSVELVIGIGTDVTDREAAQVHAQESDSTVRAMMETASQAILALSQSGRIMMANPAAERMYGYGGQELVGLPLENLMPERCRERYAAHLMKWFSQPGSRPMSVGMELSCLRRDGGEFPAEVSLSSISTRDGTLGVAFIADITERKENERTLLAYQRQLQTLAAGLIAAQESGNRELARELHDVFSQDLAAIGMEISSLKEESKSDDNLVAHLSDLGNRITRLAAEMHRTSREIHPAIVEELGLEPALRQECEASQRRSAIPTQFTAENVPAELPTEVALCLYRIAQESLRNVHKHSPEADWVHISLEASPERVTLRIEDAGDGFELNAALRKGGLGLISMEERIRLVKGELTIHSHPGKGTTVTGLVPLEKKPV